MVEKDTPLLFKVSNHVFGIAFIIMDIFIFYRQKDDKPDKENVSKESISL